MEKIRLPQVTLAAMTSVSVYETVQALRYSCREIEFGDVVLISDKKPWYLPRFIRFSKTEPLTTIDDFNYRMVYELKDHIRTEYCLLVHYDGFVVHPELWRDSFLPYDYIGSPWPLPKNDYAYRDTDGNIVRVGNSVSLRSRRLMEFPAAHAIPWVPVDDGFYNEDIFLCCHCRKAMEAEGLRFAPIEEAVHFGREHPLPENDGIEPFVFHKWWGENEKFPRFVGPKERVKRLIRPLLFWRRSSRWKKAHGME